MSGNPFFGMSPAEVAWADQKFARAASGVDGLLMFDKQADPAITDSERMMVILRAIEALPANEKRQDMINHWFAVAIVRLGKLERETAE